MLFVMVLPPSGILVDTVPPVTAVRPLAAYQTDFSFYVNWSGTDAGVGLDSFDVQYQDTSNGVWTDWILNTRETSSGFFGERGHTYMFRSRARDRDKNVEEYPTVADATTTVSLYTIRGVIKNNREAPVLLAPVTVKPVGPIATSKEDGSYTVGIPKEGSYDIQVNYPSTYYGIIYPNKIHIHTS
jgi:hypothetical protein